jgi:hypothetical protein
VTELGNRRAVEEDRLAPLTFDLNRHVVILGIGRPLAPPALLPFTSMVQQCSDGEPLGSVNANASFGC